MNNLPFAREALPCWGYDRYTLAGAQEAMDGTRKTGINTESVQLPPPWAKERRNGREQACMTLRFPSVVKMKFRRRCMELASDEVIIASHATNIYTVAPSKIQP